MQLINHYRRLSIAALSFSLFMLMTSATYKLAAQDYGPGPSLSSSEIEKALDRLQTLGSVLYLAAHPDDENTRLITYYSKGKGLETAYLSLSRGVGGQNLIGKEVRELMGVIRTQELLAARRIDGGQQFFSRANDFGFSKIPDETLTIWDSTAVLADVVWAIRKHRPDVIFTRFSPNRPGLTHGHHTTSAMLGEQAFKLAADTAAFPEQLEWVDAWQPKRLYWNTSWWFFRSNPDTLKKMDLLTIDMGGYDPLLGKSYGTIASQSRSMHKSQGFGSAANRGASTEYFLQLAGEKATENPFEDIDLSWKRVPGSEKVAQLLAKAGEDFNHRHPENILPILAEAYREMEKLPASNYWVGIKKEQLAELMLQCAGVWASATTADYRYAPGDSVALQLNLISRNPAEAMLKRVHYPEGPITYDSVMATNQMLSIDAKLLLPENQPISQPYWLQTQSTQKGMYEVADQQLIGKAENDPAIVATAVYAFPALGGLELSQRLPLNYQSVDPVEGERYRPLEVAPAVTLTIETPNMVFAGNEPKKLTVTAKTHTAKASGRILPQVPNGWTVSPSQATFAIEEKYGEADYSFDVLPPKNQSVGELSFVVETENGQRYDHGLVSISYPHIPVQTLFPKVAVRLIRLDISKGGQRIGYIEGAGDAIPEALREVGYQVDLLNVDELNSQKLSIYDAVMIGVRAYNINNRLKFLQPELMKYVEAGGTLVVQYNTNRGLVTEELGPYPFKVSRDRVTVEEAPVTFLIPDHPIINQPNKISATDLENWVQERGLYFPNEWDDAYQALFSMNDPGEEAKKGSLLVANFGKGTYIYTGLSFFRELPAGVPGAYRLLANLLAYKQEKSEKPPSLTDPKLPKQ